MTIPFWHVDAFAGQAFAAVCAMEAEVRSLAPDAATSLSGAISL